MDKDLIYIIEKLLRYNQRSFATTELKRTDYLLESNILKENKDNAESLDLIISQSFLLEILNYVKCDYKEMTFNNISESFKTIDNFKKKKSKDFGINVGNRLIDLFKDLKIFVLQKYEDKKSINLNDYFLQIFEDYPTDSNSYDISRIFFEYLPSSNFSIKEIANICSSAFEKENLTHSVIIFLRDYAKTNVEKATRLLNYLDKENSSLRIQSHLLIGIFNGGEIKTFDTALAFKDQELLECLFVLGRINYQNKSQIQRAFETVENIQILDINLASEQAYLLVHLINNPETPKNILKKSFNSLNTLLIEGSTEIIDSVFHIITYHLKDYDYDKYTLLLNYLSKTSNFKIIDSFFYQIKDPRYIFDLVKSCFSANPNYRFPIKIFQGAITHAWNMNEKKTEVLILDLFDEHPAFSILAVNIILSANKGVYQVGLRKLKKKQTQINAIKGFCKSPTFFDKLIPILLELRKSKFPEVVKILQKELSDKVFYSYHESIFKIIDAGLSNTKKDKEFIKPIKKALDNYNELKNLKASIKDLDPRENESDLMHLYYRLEREEKAKMMNKINNDENSFMKFAKNTIIIRGNSWKINDRGVSPLGNIESKMLVDENLYLNPDLFEYNMDNF